LWRAFWLTCLQKGTLGRCASQPRQCNLQRRHIVAGQELAPQLMHEAAH
jgi:hypothetical protein